MTRSIKGDTHTPHWRSPRFDCPHCGAFAQQNWVTLKRGDELDGWPTVVGDALGMRDVFAASTCLACDRSAVWLKAPAMVGPGAPITPSRLVWPLPDVYEHPLPDETPEAVSALWDEARRVAPVSARGAAAILRLALQVLLQEHVTPGERHLSTAISKAFASGLPEPVQQAMDFLRLTGNDAAHAAEVRLDEDAETLRAMFGLLRYVTEETVVRSSRVRSLYASLPPAKRAEIEKRNQKALEATRQVTVTPDNP